MRPACPHGAATGDFMKSIHRLCKEGSAGVLVLTFTAVAVGTATAVAWPAIFADRPGAATKSVVADSKKTVEGPSSPKGGAVLLHAGINGSVEEADYAQTHQWLR